MIILTGEHRDKYIDMLKQSYEQDEKLLEDKDTLYYVIGGEDKLEDFKHSIIEKKERYEFVKDKEQIELDPDYKASENIKDNWIWIFAILALFGGGFGGKAPDNNGEIS